LIVLADNDIILKLAQCDLLEVLPDSLGQEWAELFIFPTAKHYTCRKMPIMQHSKIYHANLALLPVSNIIPSNNTLHASRKNSAPRRVTYFWGNEK
jgi:hypothetical protein